MAEIKVITIGIARFDIPAEQYDEAQDWLRNNVVTIDAFQARFPDAKPQRMGVLGGSARGPNG